MTDEPVTIVITYAELLDWRLRHPGEYFIGPVAEPDIDEIRPSWPFSLRQAEDEADRWVGELARLQAYVLATKPPVDTPLGGSVVAAMERAARIVQKLELDVPDIWHLVDLEVTRLRSRR
jgi:hypothetical protein